MGRFEKRPENPRIRGELSRAAENALWDVVEDLENLQQNLLRSLQEDVKRLETEKNRLSGDIQRLIEEKENLQQSRQITEQQVLIRQLAEVLAKHISSQLQSSLKTLATQSVEHNSSDSSALQNTQLNNNAIHEIGQNVTNMLDSLDGTVTIAFNSLLQELKNYQGDLSQQLSRMYSQQQQGEAILAEFVNRLRSEVEKNRDANSVKTTTGGAPTVLQLADNLRGEAITHQNGSSEKSPQRIMVEPVALIPHESAHSDSTSAANAVILSSPIDNTSKPSSFVNPDLPTVIPDNKTPEPSSFVNPDLPTVIPDNKTPEPSSFVNPDTSAADKASVPSSFVSLDTPSEDPNSELGAILTSKVLTAPSLGDTKPEPLSVLTPNLPTGRPPTPKLRRETTPKQPTTPEQPITPQQQITPRQQRSRTSPNWSQLQIGFLFIALSTVVSSLYNVAIKAIFFTASNPLGGLPTQQLIFPTLGNIFLILMLRLLVVVPLMLLLSPILHPPIWQELENLFASLGANATPTQNKTKQALFLSVISGCLLFVSQVFIYIAIGEVTTGMAIALFFVYPVMSVFLCWFLFQERPNSLVTGAMAAIFCGELLVLGSQSTGVNNTALGSTTAILSGIAFAIYVILTRICATKLKLHPVSLTLINFTTMLLLSLICLIIPLPGNLSVAISSSNILELVLSAFILGVLTLCGYLFNNFGIRKLGSPFSSLIGATVPILTVIFAGIMLQESLNIVQVIGVILVTLGAASISWKKPPNQLQPTK
ncbi:EamA family transporter [Dolichospermum heterosporum]|uniref:EamA family transporter n=1 Tax=Dolichospermum heterosporum TAC447 TaxID=747523 RepID=A0ABY5LT65_9CYAN|nr:EamA family transporter [Dolichospermum heterosporum]UUO15142.1 EamA family transporter [Dolichospermum heterosporum TAC447]